jgi:hypothetical protein
MDIDPDGPPALGSAAVIMPGHFPGRLSLPQLIVLSDIMQEEVQGRPIDSSRPFTFGLIEGNINFAITDR